MPAAHTSLSRDRVLDGALALADRVGIESLTIRRLAEQLGVKAMTIYYYVPSKEAIVDGMVERVFAQIALPPPELSWDQAIRVRCVSARRVLNQHPWAAPLLESRSAPGPDNLRHHEAVLACLRRGGLSWQLTAHAYAVLDSYIYGFAFEEATLPESGSDSFTESTTEIAAAFDPQKFPTLAAFAAEHVLSPDYSFGHSFEFGLDLLISGLVSAAHDAS